MSNKRESGGIGEQIALDYLLVKGYKLVERNFTCRLGEIDLICEKDGFIVFIEVKSLDINSEFYIYSTLTKFKKKRLKKAINTWLLKHNKLEDVWRADFVGVLVDKASANHKIEHFEFIDLSK